MNTHRVRSPSYGLGVTDRAVLAKLRPGRFDGQFSDFVAQLGHPASRTLMSCIKLAERGLITLSGDLSVTGDIHAQVTRSSARGRAAS